MARANSADRSAWVVVGLEAVCASLAVALLGIYAWAVFHRIGHPFDLEWMEGGMVDHVARILDGRPLYAPPDLEFTPFIYNPAYYYVCAAVALLTGPGYLPLRLVSVVSSVACFALIHALVFRECRRHLPAILAAATFASTYPVTTGWFDVGRVDSMFLALCLGCFLTVRDCRGTLRSVIVTAGLLWAAFLTKQPGLLLVPAAAAWVLVNRGLRPALLLAGATTVLIIGSVGILDVLHGGWYRFYALELPSAHAFGDPWALHFWRNELLEPLPLAALALATLVLSRPLAADAPPGSRSFHTLLAGSFIGIAYASRVHVGSFQNDLMPAHAALAVAFGVGVESLARRLSTSSSLSALLPVAGALQLALRLYDPTPLVPSAADRASGEQLVRALRDTPGEILTGYRGHLGVAAGKPVHSHQMAKLDLFRLRGDSRGAKERLRSQFASAFAQKRFSLVVLDNLDFVFMGELTDHYRRTRFDLLPEAAGFWTRTGSPMRPRYAFSPR